MSYHHLSSEERALLYSFQRLGWSQRKIGQALARSHSTINRELRRNRRKDGYDPVVAHNVTRQRRKAPRHHKRLGYSPLVDAVLKWLCQDWSPQIISQCLKEQYPADSRMRISHESIYAWVYRDAAAGGQLYQHLWHRRPRRKRQRPINRFRALIDRVSIDERPEEAETRQHVGHWEGDSVEGGKGKGGMVTHVDRASRLLTATLLPDKRAESFTHSTLKALGWVPRALCKTLTLDNGTENADFKTIEREKGMKVYFADPYSPWQRGSNEQVNGMLRRYFPKGTDFRTVTQEEVDEVVLKINQRPRKCLGYRAPYDVFADALRGALAT